GSGLPISRTAMAREINTLKGQVLDIAKERDFLARDNQEMHEELDQQKREIDELKEIVKQLAAR
ncbi:MAG: hypothetical protein ACLTJQ_08175, partial [Dialister invisus]|uniref:hypothetical protein n=1 Tax=Dialister invisus TaxID=218538 RepID=UPI0039933C4F